MKSSEKKRKVKGQDSWRLASSTVELFVTEQGGMAAPVVFDRKGAKITPFSVAPWVGEKIAPEFPQLLKVLRGDFFCMPFGGNETPYRGEKHPPHGETANSKWKFRGISVGDGAKTLGLRMKPRMRAATVDKEITVADGHDAVYSRHVVSGMKGTMSFGHHAMLKFPDRPESGILSTSQIRYGLVSPAPAELPENKGYSVLECGRKFRDLSRVRTVRGGYADLTRYPARRGFEDIVMLVTKQREPFAWTAVTFPKERYVWFSLKDPAVLRQTILWFSNGGRHYPPWNGRHVNVMGLEDVTSFFHYGLAQSAANNRVKEGGDPTVMRLTPKRPLTVNYIMAVAKIPNGFTRVAAIEPSHETGQVNLICESRKRVSVPLNYGFLKEGGD